MNRGEAIDILLGLVDEDIGIQNLEDQHIDAVMSVVKFLQSNEHDKHSYQDGGIIYAVGGHLPGSSARNLIHAQMYYCTECMDKNVQRLDIQKNSYEGPLDDARPVTIDELEILKKQEPWSLL